MTAIKRWTFALCGISHVSNLGCEAIIRSTCAMLKACFPGCHIIYASRSAKSDAAILKDLDIAIIQLSRRPDPISRAVNKGLFMLGVRKRILYDRPRAMPKGLDAVISVGGDIYTMDKRQLQAKRCRCPNTLGQLEKRLKTKGAKLILYGASVGPFPKANGNEAYFVQHLNRMDLLVCREADTVDYLKTAGVKAPILFSPDPAFFLRPGEERRSMDKRAGIAVNLSPHMLDPDQSWDEQLRMLGLLVAQIGERLNEKIILLPHVYAENTQDDDLTILQGVLDHIPLTFRKNVELCPEKRSFFEAKAVLKNCKMLIAARMHCAINAMCERTPTILISYSPKSVGMCRMVYKTSHWVISDEELETRLLPLAEEMYWQAPEIQRYLNVRMETLCAPSAREGVKERLKELMEMKEEK